MSVTTKNQGSDRRSIDNAILCLDQRDLEPADKVLRTHRRFRRSRRAVRRHRSPSKSRRTSGRRVLPHRESGCRRRAAGEQRIEQHIRARVFGRARSGRLDAVRARHRSAWRNHHGQIHREKPGWRWSRRIDGRILLVDQHLSMRAIRVWARQSVRSCQTARSRDKSPLQIPGDATLGLTTSSRKPIRPTWSPNGRRSNNTTRATSAHRRRSDVSDLSRPPCWVSACPSSPQTRRRMRRDDVDGQSVTYFFLSPNAGLSADDTFLGSRTVEAWRLVK